MAVRLAYEAWGEGPRTLLLLHGFTGDHTSFDHLRPLLGRELRAIVVDLPGHGRTPLPGLGGRAGHLETLQAVIDVVDRLGLQSVDLLGYSMGGRIALGAALAAPERFGRLILEGCSPGLRQGTEQRERLALDRLRADQVRALGVDTFMAMWEAQPLFASLQRLPPALRAALELRRRACSASGLAGALEALGTGIQPDYWPELPRVDQPTLLLTGALDAKYTEMARRMAAKLPVAYHSIIADCGHAPHLEAPDVYARELLAFLGAPLREMLRCASSRPI